MILGILCALEYFSHKMLHEIYNQYQSSPFELCQFIGGDISALYPKSAPLFLLWLSCCMPQHTFQGYSFPFQVLSFLTFCLSLPNDASWQQPFEPQSTLLMALFLCLTEHCSFCQGKFYIGELKKYISSALEFACNYQYRKLEVIEKEVTTENCQTDVILF